jgi:hypothetical protein
MRFLLEFTYITHVAYLNGVTHMCSRMNDKKSSFSLRRDGFLFRRSTTGQVTLILIPTDLRVAQEVRSGIIKVSRLISIYDRA